jgi:molybdate transport repressor ModE-like protein
MAQEACRRPIYSWWMLDVTRLRVLVAIARHGSVTAAARALNYAQPSISHHIARLEAETGARLLERAGRGVRLTEAGRMLAERAEEIIGRLDAAEAELAAHVGLREGRVRLAAFPSALGTLVPAAAARLEAETPGLDLRLTEAEPPEALRMLRAGYVDVALVFQHYQEGLDAGPPSPAEEGTRGRLILDEPVHMVTRAAQQAQDGHDGASEDSAGADRAAESNGAAPPILTAPTRRAEPATVGPTAAGIVPVGSAPASTAAVGTAEASALAAPDLTTYAESRWIAGCERCRSYLVRQCEAVGFTPKIAFTTDDYVAVQALVAAGLGVTTLPGLCLRAARHPGLITAPLAGSRRHVFAITYGQPPDPAATTRLIDVLEREASADG